MADQQQLLRARALGGDEAALDELLQAARAAAERERDLAISVAERSVVDAIRTLGTHWSVSGVSPGSFPAASVSCLAVPPSLMTDPVHPQEHWIHNGEERHLCGASPPPLAHRRGWRADPCLVHGARAHRCPDSDRVDPLVADWAGLMACPSSLKLRLLVLRLYMTMGLMLAAVPDIRVGVS
jgi:hypothetical protein